MTGQSSRVDVTDLNTSVESFQWSTTGNKRARVTAENCGGSAVAYQDILVVDPADLPDLLVSSAWNDKQQGRIGYVMRNQGATAVPAGFRVALEWGIHTPAAGSFPLTLGPGGIGFGYVDWAWGCAGETETIGVLADWTDVVVELDESNNRWSDVWNCDQQPPSILSGPTVVGITETRARVEWSTDEDCQGRVEYGTSPYNQGLNAPGSGAYDSTHAVSLTGLNPGTTYYGVALCTDAAGLAVNSAPIQFETDPPGSDPPVVRSLGVKQYPSFYYEFWQVDVEMEDDAFMDRVTCAMDGVPLGIDYSADTNGDYPIYSVYVSPYALGLTRDEFFGQYTFFEISCTAHRQAPTAFTTLAQNVQFPGEAAPPLRLWIDEPHPNHKIIIPGRVVPDGTTLDVTVLASAYEWGCSNTGFSDGDAVPPGLEPVRCAEVTERQAGAVQLFIDGALADTEVPSSPSFP